jgi:trk system potassium uptake protein TrkA
MKIIIVGGGLVGRGLVHQLSARHNVVVIDRDLKKCEDIYAQYSAVTLNGDAKDLRILKSAGIEKADYFIASTGSDAENMVLTLLANGFSVPQIFVCMYDPEYENAYKMAGATEIASMATMVIHKFTLDIEKPEIRRLASFSDGKAEISIIDLPRESIHVGKTIATIAKDAGFPEDCIIAGVFDVENDALVIPRGHQVIEGGNQLFLVGSSASIEGAYTYFNKVHK